MKVLRWGLRLGLLVIAATTLVGFAGRLHPAADSVSLLRFPFGLLCLLGILVNWGAVVRLAVTGVGVAAAITTLPYFVMQHEGGSLRVYTKNVWYRNAELPALAADIMESDADVVLLQEVSTRNDQLLALLAEGYPHQHLCRSARWSGIAVLSRAPFLQTACTDGRAATAAQIMHDDSPVWVVSTHLFWPHPYNNAGATASVIRMIAAFDGPMVIGGDFNIFPWAASIGQIRQVADLRTAGPLRATYHLQGTPLFLDHLHGPGGGAVRYRPYLGSDHRGVVGDMRLTP
ncbi:endonuclease/exonuclease/phosphatase family protein [Yoonia sp. SS1-5]|uniref:Endonuclease/exonuclease/phosphatase family protein n=1 Tax=Yoonia rhodophyticola TaxID=3137370 RepID=A0AAN0M771_9RHOB